jgi:hypothetical protein
MPKVKALAAQAAAYGDDRLRLHGLERLVAIDPGDVHVGWAEFCEENDGTAVCYLAEELTPEECADRVARMLFRGEIRYLAVERFALYADKALAQVGSEMQTSELIGVLKYLVRVHNLGAAGATDPWSKVECEMWIQGADIKKPIRAQMKARGIERTTPVGSHHGDAEEHGWYRILRGKEGK